MSQYDDPNREVVGVQPIWTGAGDPQRDDDQTPEPDPDEGDEGEPEPQPTTAKRRR